MSFKKISTFEISTREPGIFGKLIIFASIISLNISLMLFVSFYWINPDFHSLVTGKPF